MNILITESQLKKLIENIIREAIIMPSEFDELKEKLKHVKTLEEHKELFNQYDIDLITISQFREILKKQYKTTMSQNLPSIFAYFNEITKRTGIIINDKYYNDKYIYDAINNLPQQMGMDLETILFHENIHFGQVSRWKGHYSPKFIDASTKEKEYFSQKEEIMAISNTIVNNLIKNQNLKNLDKLEEKLKYDHLYKKIKDTVEPQVLNRYKKYIYLYAEKYLNKNINENININIVSEQQQNNNRELELLKKKAPMDEWFYENIVDKVKQITYPEYPDKIYYLNKNSGQEYMVYDQKNGHFWVNYYKIWKYFESNYSHNDKEIERLIKDLVGEHYNLWGITPQVI